MVHMSYILHGKSLLGLQSDDPDHCLLAYAVRVSPTPRGRWVTVSCSCGAAARARWEDTTANYRSLVMVAWFDACTTTVDLDAESLPR